MTENFWKVIALPLLFLVIFLTLYSLWNLFDLPPHDELVEIMRGFFDRWGLWVVFVSAILEALLLVGWYYPGSLAIFLGVVFSGGDVGRVVLVVILATAGIVIGYLINYALGKYGWYRLLLAFGLKEQLEKAQKRLIRYGLSGMFLSYWHPAFAALTSTAAGILQYPFRKFALYSLAIVTVWDIFWGTVAYFFGEALLLVVGIRLVLIIIAAWIIVEFVKRHRQSKIESEAYN